MTYPLLEVGLNKARIWYYHWFLLSSLIISNIFDVVFVRSRSFSPETYSMYSPKGKPIMTHFALCDTVKSTGPSCSSYSLRILSLRATPINNISWFFSWMWNFIPSFLCPAKSLPLSEIIPTNLTLGFISKTFLQIDSNSPNGFFVPCHLDCNLGKHVLKQRAWLSPMRDKSRSQSCRTRILTCLDPIESYFHSIA